MLHEMWMYRMNLPFPISLVLLSLQITHPTIATNIHLSIAGVKCQLMFSPHCFMSFLKKKNVLQKWKLGMGGITFLYYIQALFCLIFMFYLI